MRKKSSIIAAIALTAASSTVAAPRSIDGSGNSTGDQGTAETMFQRMAPADYGDGISSLSGGNRPDPRTISNAVNFQPSTIINSRGGSDYMWQWGQFIDHDVTLALPTSGEFEPIIVPGDDPLSPMIPFERSLFDLSTGSSVDNPRQQINHNTSFIDASMVYGSDQPRADFLRTMSGGLLKTADGNLLPFNTGGFANETLHLVPDDALRIAGDVRANEQPALTAMHTVFVREHNRLATGLAGANPGWTDEQIYQRARKLVGATVQSITYNEWLPALLGSRTPNVTSFEYDSSVNPAMANEFSTALFRLGHTLVSPQLRRVTDDGTEAIGGSISLRDAFFDPETSGSSEEIEFFLMGLASQRHQEIDPMINEELRTFLFGAPGSGGMDLAALNIQRGREHGVPDYNTLRENLGLARVSAFEDISSDPNLVASLTELYSTVDDIDPWIGALSEDHVPGAGVGELIATGFEWQFGRLAEGDTFFYRWDEDLSPEDIALIEDTTLADVIMRNTSLTNLQGNVFFVVPEPAPAALVSPVLVLALLRRRRAC